MGHRNVFEPEEALIRIDGKCPLKQSLRGGAGKALMDVVCLDQKRNVFGCITPAETVARGTFHDDESAPSLAGNESSDLGIGVTGDDLTVVLEDGLVFLAKFEIAKPLKHSIEPRVFFMTRNSLELYSGDALEKLPYTSNVCYLGVVHVDCHSLPL